MVKNHGAWCLPIRCMQQEEQDRGPGCVPDTDKGPVAQLPAPPPPAHSLLQGPSMQLIVGCSAQCSASDAMQCPASGAVPSSIPAPLPAKFTIRSCGCDHRPGLSASEVGNGQIAAGGATQIRVRPRYNSSKHMFQAQIQLRYILTSNTNNSNIIH